MNKNWSTALDGIGGKRNLFLLSTFKKMLHVYTVHSLIDDRSYKQDKVPNSYMS